MKLLIVDTETGGTDPRVHSILQVGFCAWDSIEGIFDEFTTYIREDPITVTPTAMKINRIDLAKLEHAPDPSTALRRFRDWLYNARMVSTWENEFPDHLDSRWRIMLAGHNIDFDTGFLKRWYDLAGENYERDFSHRTLDVPTLVRAGTIGRGQAKYLMTAPDELTPFSSMDAINKAYDIVIPEEDRHTGLGDARATAKLLDRFVRKC